MPYTGKSQLALACRVSAVTLGLVYGASKYSWLKGKVEAAKKSAAKAAAKAPPASHLAPEHH
eukprot:jgi/Chlat1/3641/Chrsp238S03630